MLLPLAVLFAVPAQAANQSYSISSFDSIRVLAPVRILVTTGAGVSARGEGDRNALDRVDLSMAGSTLTVRMKPAQMNEAAGGQATIILSTGQLQRAMLAGGGSLSIDRMKGVNAMVQLSGSGDVSVGTVAADRLDIAIMGSGRLTAAGATDVLNATLSGPGALAGEGLKAKQVKLLGDGPGDATVTATVSADVVARGSGDVTILGKAACKVNRGGTGNIQCGGKSF
ncbi:DUF2807 domain-containing protein [Sphingobium phenoxybenzoativorans]|uniref:DUF2807 domain-containing protein n=1 Tax=Sphingobium phenoxybenzoativorans TaxID=1592790 RepID=A0A975Q252_9SPHN|nr:head GIN domain-containing protein [Sphingobium phenoxybenzoativorans]QUT06640.1 DUF2807 domain-containing protein [Sphingobium phenoxybenzoativorans]